MSATPFSPIATAASPFSTTTRSPMPARGTAPIATSESPVMRRATSSRSVEAQSTARDSSSTTSRTGALRVVPGHGRAESAFTGTLSIRFSVARKMRVSAAATALMLARRTSTPGPFAGG